MIGELAESVVAGPGRLGYKDAPFPGPGKLKEVLFVAAKKPAKKAAKAVKKPAKPVAKKAAPARKAPAKPVPKKAVATKPAAKKAVAKKPAPKKAVAKKPAPRKPTAKVAARKAPASRKPAPAPKPVLKKAAGKPATKPVAKPVAKPGPRPAPKPTGKATAKLPNKAAAPKPVTKPAAKSGPKPAPVAKPAAPVAVAKPAAAKAPAKQSGRNTAKPSGAPHVHVPKAPIPRPIGKVAVAVISRPSAAPKPRGKVKVVAYKTDPANGRPLIPNGYRPSADEEYMSPLQLEYFRQRLFTWRTDLVEESKQTIENLKEEVRDVGDEAERATRETENSLELRTRDRYRKLIGKIDSTLKRMEGGDYGYCAETGEEIGLERLDARLTAERTIDAQERWEHLQKQQGD